MLQWAYFKAVINILMIIFFRLEIYFLIDKDTFGLALKRLEWIFKPNQEINFFNKKYKNMIAASEQQDGEPETKR